MDNGISSIVNIINNFIPNEIKRTTTRDPPWITKSLKTMIKKKNRLFNNYKRHGYRTKELGWKNSEMNAKS